MPSPPPRRYEIFRRGRPSDFVFDSTMTITRVMVLYYSLSNRKSRGGKINIVISFPPPGGSMKHSCSAEHSVSPHTYPLTNHPPTHTSHPPIHPPVVIPPSLTAVGGQPAQVRIRTRTSDSRTHAHVDDTLVQ